MARAREATALRDEPSARGELMMLEGRFASDTGAYDEAIAFFDEAEAECDDETSLVSWEALYSGRGEAKQRSGQLAEAVEDYERVLDKLRALPRNSLIFAYALQGLGGTLLRLNRLEEAEAPLVQLRDTFLDQQPDAPDLAGVRFNLAQLYGARGEHNAALEELEQVQERFEAHGGPEHPGATAARSAMAEQYEALGRFVDARREAQAALRWNVPQEFAGGAHLVLARLAIQEGSTARARDRLRALIDNPETAPEVRDTAAALARSLEQ